MAAMQPPPGLDLSENRSPHVTRTVVPIAVLSTIAVACRLYSRKLKRLDFAAHDYLIIGGLILAWGCAAETITSTLPLYLHFSCECKPLLMLTSLLISGTLWDGETCLRGTSRRRNERLEGKIYSFGGSKTRSGL